MGASGCHDGASGLSSRLSARRACRPPLGSESILLSGALHVRRVKRGTPSTHPILGDELRALRRLQRGTGAQVTIRWSHFGTGCAVRALRASRAWSKRAGAETKLAFKKLTRHMLRHACGYALANKGHDTRALQAYLGHRNIQHTVRYTELSATRFKDFWRR